MSQKDGVDAHGEQITSFESDKVQALLVYLAIEHEAPQRREKSALNERTLSAPGDIWTQTVVVTVDVSYIGLLTNVQQVTSEEGAMGSFTCTVSVDEAVAGLAAANDNPTILGDATC